MNILKDFPRKAYGEDALRLSNEITYFQDGIFPEAGELIALFFPSSRPVEGANASIFLTQGAGERESFSLTVTSQGARISAPDADGCRHALACLSLAAYFSCGEWRIPAMEEASAPCDAHRGMMLDLARGIRPLEKLKEDLILIAKARLNTVHFHLADSKGICFEAESLPPELRLEGAYTKEEMRSVVSLCRLLGLKVIPEYDLPAHSKVLIRTLPHLGCEVEGRTVWCICAGSPDVMGIFRGILTEIAELFPGEYLHIGGDELSFDDHPALNQLCHWDDCPRCSAYAKEKGLSNREELYYDVILRVYEIVRSLGRKMMMWSDQVNCAAPCPLPRDILMQFWRVAGKGRGPHEGCSLEKLLEMGYRAVNSTVRETYVDLEQYLKPETLATWRPRRRPPVAEDLQERIVGGEICAWEYGNHLRYPHYDRSLAPVILLFGELLWSNEDLQWEESCYRALTRGVLGQAIPPETNVIPAIGSPVPPRNGELCYPERVSATREEIQGLLDLLRSLTYESYGSLFRMKAYEEILASQL